MLSPRFNRRRSDAARWTYAILQIRGVSRLARATVIGQIGRATADSVGHVAATAGEIMPSLMRFLIVVAILGGAGFAAVYWLANYVEPKPREMTIRVPADKFREQ